jgi:Rod binding domain-containing protein
MSLPPIDQAMLPADIRKGSAADKKTYTAALGFERMLLGELTKAMTDTANPTGSSSADDSTGADSSQSTDAASSMYMQMLPDQLADSITQNGGLGLARTFYDSLKEKS